MKNQFALAALLGAFLLIGCGNDNCPNGINYSNPSCPGYVNPYAQNTQFPNTQFPNGFPNNQFQNPHFQNPQFQNPQFQNPQVPVCPPGLICGITPYPAGYVPYQPFLADDEE